MTSLESQPEILGGLVYGRRFPEQWGEGGQKGQLADFYSVKGDLETLLAGLDVRFETIADPAMHPGRSASVLVAGKLAGKLGELHPKWQQKYELPIAPIVFELEYDALSETVIPAHRDIAKVPPVRRDLAALFDESIAHDVVIDELRRHAPPVVTDVRLFDVYRGKDLETGKKSLAFSILLQDTRKTLTDAEIESTVAKLREVLRQRFDAKLR